MKLEAKGASAELESVKQLKVKMSWTTAADFDLAALYKSKTGDTGLVYFGKLGDLNAFPFIKLDGDAGVGDTGGDNAETLKITQMDSMSEIHLLVWDYEAVKKGEAARFGGSDVKVNIMNDKGENHDVVPTAGEVGNVVIIAKIDNSSPMGAQLVNESKAATLKGFSDSKQLWDVVNQA